MVEVGPGFGLATDVLRQRVGNLTAVEIDPALAVGLALRLTGTNVNVLQADGTHACVEVREVPGGSTTKTSRSPMTSRTVPEWR